MAKADMSFRIKLKDSTNGRMQGRRPTGNPRKRGTLKNKSCLDTSGTRKEHGTYYTPVNSVCTLCLCDNGSPDGCIRLRCQTPECDDFKQVSGTCCHYRCPGGNSFPDKTTLAVVISLVVVLALTLAAITFIVRKMKRGQNRYNEDLSRTSLNITQPHQPPESRMNPAILLNSIPNNLRCPQDSMPIAAPEASSTSKDKCVNRVNMDTFELTHSNTFKIDSNKHSNDSNNVGNTDENQLVTKNCCYQQDVKLCLEPSLQTASTSAYSSYSSNYSNYFSSIVMVE